MKSTHLPVIMYHYIRKQDSSFPHLKVRTPEEFEVQLQELMRRFTVISWAELRDHLISGAALPGRACLLTFDDGFIDHYTEVYPRLRERGLSGLFFVSARRESRSMAPVHTLQLLIGHFGEEEIRKLVMSALTPDQRKRFDSYYEQCLGEYPTDRFGELSLRTFRRVINFYMSSEMTPILEGLFRTHIGDPDAFAETFYMSGEMLREMAQNNMHFGGHGVTHQRLSRIAPDLLTQEIASSAAFLAPLEAKPWAFSYPYSDYPPTIFRLLEAHDFIAGFLDRNGDIPCNQYELGRIDTAVFSQWIETQPTL